MAIRSHRLPAQRSTASIASGFPSPIECPKRQHHLMLLLCIPASCASSVSGPVAAALTCLMLRRSELDLDDNEITSLAGATFAGEIE